MSKQKKTAPPSRRPRRGAWPVAGVLLALVIVAFVAHAWEFQYTQDDAYISLRYARNLVRGDGLVFNPGERVEGYSNFAWTMLLSACLRAGLPPIETSRWLGVAFAVLGILSAARLGRALEGRWGVTSVGAAALLAGCSALALWSTGGLETGLFLFLVTTALERGLSPGVGERARVLAPLLFALAALTRPEGPFVFAMWFAIRAHDTWRGGPTAASGGVRTLLRDVALFAAPLVPYAAWKLWYYGDLLPNTYYAKAGTSWEYVRRGIDYALEFARAYALFGAVPLLAIWAAVRTGWKGLEIRLLAIWLGYATYIVVIGGDVLHVHRFWLAILPIGCVLVARGTGLAAARLVRGSAPATLLAALAIAVMIGTGLSRNWSFVMMRRNQEIGLVQNMAETGRWLARHFDRDATIAITTIGAISYESDLRVIDMLGLTDREIAHDPDPVPGLQDTWREIKYNAASVLRREPDAILFSTGIRPSSAAEKSLFLYESFDRDYRAYYFRSTPTRVDLQSMFRRRETAGPFDDRRRAAALSFVDDYLEGHIAKSRNHDNVEAAKLFRRSWETAPDFLWAREWEGVARFDAGDTTAVEILRDVVAKDSTLVAAWGRLGSHYLETRNLDDAERVFDQLRRLDPDDNMPWTGLAEVYRLRGDAQKGYEYARHSLEIWTASPNHLQLFAVLAASIGRFDEAQRALESSLQLQPTGPVADMGRELLRQIRAAASSRGAPGANGP
ncbi:MAG: tetratricopeptide repeat protein [Gemmatimonadetes bacterium]|nr:tetratricopeptide repeat protein [Gemmatimonadota bacterium]